MATRKGVARHPSAIAFPVLFFVFLFALPSRAQLGGMGARPGGGAQSGPTQSGPTQNKQVGPRQYGDEDEDQRIQVSQRPEPSAGPPADPLAIPPALKDRIGTDYDGPPPPPSGSLHRTIIPPYYEESRGDYRFRFLPPLWLEHTRGAGGGAKDRQSLFGLLYYQRRSPSYDADVLFPLAWSIRDQAAHVWAFGPLAHREAPHQHDNWVAPLFFEGNHTTSAYFHSPLLLTTSHWNEHGAFTVTGPFFRDRTEKDVDWGVVPLYFHGDNGNLEGSRRRYWLVPPLLTFHNEHEVDESQLTVVGPVIWRTNPKRAIFDLAPLLFTINGRPQSGGIHESHVTLLPLFHWGRSDENDERLLVLPGLLHRTTKTTYTLLTPLYSHATTRSGGDSLSIVGPLVPFYYHRHDVDTGLTAWFVAPFYYQSASPAGHDFLTPFVGRFETYGVSRSWWFFPTLTVSNDLHGWETDIHPLLYLGRSDQSSHTVIAPLFWDFASEKGRTTIGFPVYWRFADTNDGTVTQIAANTLYRQKRAPGGFDWQFHVLPLWSYGESPGGYWWNVLFGLVGFDKEPTRTRIKAFWIPITVSSSQ